ncbi:putative nuclease HARBI1 [Ambystoma mexicanum]|uniref:putative nuclease HARBI1 n=1 Tax=Ambystoma mexicanum TaxID=8296 RepID=UPI0037E70221
MLPLVLAILGLEDMPALLLLEQAVQQETQRRRRRRRRVRHAQQIPPVQAVAPRRQPTIQRIRSNPFDLTPAQIHTLYRLDRDTITNIVELIQDDLVSLFNIRTAIPPLLKVASVLHFLATGTYQHTVDQMHGMSQSCFSVVLNQLLDALLKHANAYISLPRTPQEANATKIAFHALAGMPNVIGALDCTHVELVVPHAVEAVYRNRKLYHSINVQMVCDASQIITHCCARYPGSTHDAMVLRNSSLPRYMEGDVVRSGWLLGDAGYPLKLWLLTPVRNPQNGHEEDFNRAHTRTPVVIEQTFGLLKALFRCISRSGGALIYGPEKVGKIITACVMLHNMCIRRNIPLLPDVELPPPGEVEGEEGVEVGHRPGRETCEGRAVRQMVIDQSF